MACYGLGVDNTAGVGEGQASTPSASRAVSARASGFLHHIAMANGSEFERLPRQPAKRTTGGILAALIVLGLLAAVIAVVLWAYLERRDRIQDEATHARIMAEAAELASRPVRSSSQMPGEPRETIVDNPEGSLLWGSPTVGRPISLDFAPSGSQCFLYLRPAELVRHAEAGKVIDALGPWARDAIARLQELTAADLADIESMLVSVFVRADGKPDACLRVELSPRWHQLKSWRNLPRGEDHLYADVQKWHSFGDRAWFLLGNGGTRLAVSRLLVICPKDLALQLIDSSDSPQLTRDLESLVATSDALRTATLIVAPNFLAASGGQLLDRAAEPLAQSLAKLVGREATAVALSVNWDANFFVEVRATPALTTSPRYLATAMTQRLRTSADDVEFALERTPPSEYAARVLGRFPEMVRKLAAMARGGEADKQAVVRAYLPAVAGHNLLMGSELLLTQSGAGPAQLAPNAPPAPGSDAATVSLSLDERLAAHVSLAFPKESLERALELWGEAAGVEIEIDGPAFAAEGVTRNQSLELNLTDRPAAEILVEILRRANPDRSAASAADPRQKVVYVVEPPPAGGEGRIIVTTRAAAAERGLALPAVFDGDGR